MSTITPAKRSELERLFREFASGYLKSAEGKAIGNGLRQAQDDAQRNFAQLATSSDRDRNQDRSNEILLKLLPYANNANNRWRGAWLHVLPAISGDIRKWYEAAGWTKPGDWSAVAQTLLHFVQQCLDHPDQLDELCRNFSASPLSKGFQTATVTPILHALRPNDFLLFNNRVRHTLNYFSGSNFSQSLADYPAANRALHELIESQSEFLQKFAVRRLFLADLFTLFCHWLSAVKKYPFRKTRTWRLALGDDFWLWEEWQDGNFIALAWDDLGDIGQLKRSEFDALRNSLVTQHLDWNKRDLDQVWKFSHQLSEGDRVIVEFGDKAVLGSGTIVGDYYFVPEIGYGHRLPILWEETTARGLTISPLKATLAETDELTASSLTAAEPIDIRSIVTQPVARANLSVLHESRPSYGESEKSVVNSEQSTVNSDHSPISPSPYLPVSLSLSQTAALTFLEESTLVSWITAIERKGQAIFFGPPGVGKTFIATQLARHLSSLDSAFRIPHSAFPNPSGFHDIVQFHPAYEYEDFVQGIRPVSKGSGVEFAVVPGRFLEFCRKAETHSGRCVLVIDEINRANLSRVFGELMYLLEYRDQSVRLAADGSLFRIPANVRILGAMNTADRSIALVDHALRRRFAFIHLAPNYDVLRRYYAAQAVDFPVEALIAMLQRLNQRIDDRNYQLGHSFFLHPNLPAQLASIWQLEIEPYLEEYFFDQPDEVENWRWEKVKREFGL